MVRGTCDRCGFRRPLLREWTQAMVCRDCRDPKPNERKRRPILDRAPARPEPDMVFRPPGVLGGDDL